MTQITDITTWEEYSLLNSLMLDMVGDTYTYALLDIFDKEKLDTYLMIMDFLLKTIVKHLFHKGNEGEIISRLKRVLKNSSTSWGNNTDDLLHVHQQIVDIFAKHGLKQVEEIRTFFKN